MSSRIHSSVRAFALLALSSAAAFSQTATGQVNGTITDIQGAVVPEAVVHLTNRSTGIDTTRTANVTGGYLFVNVQPGDYVARVSKTGFRETDVAPFAVGV